jgi:hypothetical protein
MQDRVDTHQGQRPRPALGRVAAVSGIVFATLAIAAWTWFVRLRSQYPAMRRLRPTDFRFGAYEFGVVFQELAIPLALIALFSSADSFRRIVSRESTARDMRRLSGVLIAAQLLIVRYTHVAGEVATFGVLAVATTGLLGGWRMGLVAGLGTMMITGAKEFMAWPDEVFIARYEAQGLAGMLDPALLLDQFISRWPRCALRSNPLFVQRAQHDPPPCAHRSTRGPPSAPRAVRHLSACPPRGRFRAEAVLSASSAWPRELCKAETCLALSCGLAASDGMHHREKEPD